MSGHCAVHVGYRRPGIPEEHWNSAEAFALEQNPALVDELRRLLEERRITIALHGYTHQDYANGYEFQAAPDPDRRVADGRAYLERLLGTKIGMFVPPHNALSKRGLAAVSARGPEPARIVPVVPPIDASVGMAHAAELLAHRQVPRGDQPPAQHDRFVYPLVLRYRRHAEFGCHSLIPGTTLDELVSGFDEARALGGDFCLATHYWEIDDDDAQDARRVSRLRRGRS